MSQIKIPSYCDSLRIFTQNVSLYLEEHKYSHSVTLNLHQGLNSIIHGINCRDLTLSDVFRRLNDLKQGQKRDKYHILNIIVSDIEKAFLSYLENQSPDNVNTLSYTIDVRPESAVELLNTIDLIIPLPEKEKYLSRVDSLGWNALMFITRFIINESSIYLKPIFNAFFSAIGNQTAKVESLRQAAIDGYNALMIAASRNFAAINYLIDEINQIENRYIRATILKQVSKHGNNALMRAICRQPDGAFLILSTIEKLEDPQLIAEILGQSNFVSGATPLILAATRNSKLVNSILTVIRTKLTYSQQMEILNHTDVNGRKASELICEADLDEENRFYLNAHRDTNLSTIPRTPILGSSNSLFPTGSSAEPSSFLSSSNFFHCSDSFSTTQFDHILEPDIDYHFKISRPEDEVNGESDTSNSMSSPGK